MTACLIKVQLGPACLEMPLTDAMLRAAIGLTIEQCRMLRACFEDAHGVDPAALLPIEIAATERRRAPRETPRRAPAGSRPPTPAQNPTGEQDP